MNIRPPRASTWFAVALAVSVCLPSAVAQPQPAPATPAAREHLLMDAGWRFAFGHPWDTKKDFNHGTIYFSYFAKAGYGDGPAAPQFDDRGWRLLDLPHDWAVEAPFAATASASHGFKAIGRNFPDASVGWYRKSFSIPPSDLGRRISIEFDGIFRDSVVWVNGFYLGREPSGYSGFRYDLTDYLNYGGTNVIAVRVDATMEEGWFYEGAGIYRHVWLTKTAPLHVAPWGTFVTSEVSGDFANVTARATVVNDGTAAAAFDIDQTILDAGGRSLATAVVSSVALQPGETAEFPCVLRIAHPQLWSPDSPTLHQLVTTIRSAGGATDRCETTFGIRTIRFDPNQGFFLNGKRVEIKGVNAHQDFAGVGVALPDALQAWRIARLKECGVNAWRCAHNPPNPGLLDACDRLGLLVLDENRLMGPSPEQLSQLERMIRRDRNHPSVILWSLGNEEWAIEGNIKGARIAAAMQAFARRLDPTRRTTVANSGGWGGISTVIDVVGYNYIEQCNTDQQHADFPQQPGVGTEESTTRQTRGIYLDDRARGYLAPLKKATSGGNMETGWKHYAARPFLAGLFFWTGFDYRGEPNPYGWPQISSHAGICDLCGFPKDSFYYLKSWWTDQPVVHVYPHWNPAAGPGPEVAVTCYSNCDEVELSVNGRSLGRKPMEKNGHLEWKVAFEPGTLLARGFRGGIEIATDRVETAGAPAALRLIPDRTRIGADGEDVAVVTVQVVDAQGRIVPVADNQIGFKLDGPARIIGVGNGDPGSHEPDRMVENVATLPIVDWRKHAVDDAAPLSGVADELDDSAWPAAFGRRTAGQGANKASPEPASATVFRGTFELTESTAGKPVMLLLHKLLKPQSLYLNGRALTPDAPGGGAGLEFAVPPDLLRSGKNVLAVIAVPPPGGRNMEEEQSHNAVRAMLRIVTPASPWKRNAFNGLAQVIVQSEQNPGTVTLTATSAGLSGAALTIEAQPAIPRPAVPAKL
jgi:beta-galactosidase